MAIEAKRRLAIFDLDNTLLAGDSDYLWGQFLVEQGIVDGPAYERENRRFYEQYKAGTLDIQEFQRFSLQPLVQNPLEQMHELRRRFVQTRIEPIIARHALELLRRHRTRGDETLIITATNRFVTEPIASLLGVPQLLATDAEMRDGRYTGEIAGTPCFQRGKVLRLEEWLAAKGQRFSEHWFYSDSHNDVPLLEVADVPVAVNPDPQLNELARARAWPILDLRSERFPENWLSEP
ncbi:MAG: HAD family hydrolase [Nevskiales bacterium]